MYVPELARTTRIQLGVPADFDPEVPGLLSPANYAAIGKRMLETAGDRTLPHQLPFMLDSDPTAILVTDKSAVPLADTLRGVYDELGLEHPVISYVRIPKPDWRGRPPRWLTAESARLAGVLDGAAERVYIADQVVGTGTTLERASELVTNIGGTTAGYLKGDWYHNANRSDLDYAGVTSVHAEFMYSLGQKAAQAYNAQQLQTAA